MSWINNNTVSLQWGLGDFSTLHSWIIGGLSLAYHLLLICVILKKSSSSIGAYKYMLIYSAILNMAFSSIFIAVSPVIASLTHCRSILFVQGGLAMPMFMGNLFLAVGILIICQSIISPCCLFFVRYRQICNNKPVTILGVVCVVSISMIISQIGAVTFAIAAWPTPEDDMEFGVYVWLYNINRVGSYLVASLEPQLSTQSFQPPLLYFALIYLAIMITSSWSMMVFCWRKMVARVGNLGASNHTKNVHYQLKKVLLVQFLVPFIFVHLPFCLTCVAPLFYLATGGAAELMPFLFAWGPLIDAIMITACVKDYRIYVRNLFTRSGQKINTLQATRTQAETNF